MQKGRLSRGISLVLVLLGLLVGCEGGGSGGSPSGRGTSAGTARVHIQVGDGTPTQGSTSALGASVTRQRVGGIPPEVAGITLRVTANGQDIAGSPFTIGLDSGTVSVDITANVDHLFVIEITNHQGDIIFRGEATANFPAGAEPVLPITLVPLEVLRVVASQRVAAATGGEVVVTDPQSTVQGLRLVVPPQALSADTTFTVVEAQNPSNVVVLPNQAGVIVDLLQTGTTFGVLATLVFPYDPALVQDLGFSEASLQIFRFDPVAGQWAPVPRQTVDPVNHVIRAQLTSLSFYTVGGPPSVTASPRPPVADAQFVTTTEDTAREILLTGSDTDNTALTFRIVDGPTRGTLRGTPPAVTYVPDANANGRDAFTFVVNDGQQDSIPATVTIDINISVNDEPAVTVATFTVTENSAVETNVGTPLVFTDPDSGQSSTFAITAGNVGNAFAINASTGQLTVANSAALDFETRSTFSLTVQVTDNGTPPLSSSGTITVNVANVNEAPTNIALSNASVAENQPAGAALGTFSASDPDVGDTHTFTLVAGTGSTDNASFQIVGTQLRTNAVFDFETKSSLSLRVRATDSGSLTFEQVFLISVTNGHEAPTNITLSNASVAENQPSGTAVGTFSATDPDVGDTHTFTLVAGTGSTDNASFQIVGTQLRTNAVFDFETKSSLSLRVRATDSGSLTFEQVFLISVTNGHEAPTNITLSNASVAENQPSGTAVGTFSATDPDVGDTHTFTLVAGTGSTDNASFQIVGTQLRTNAVFDFETKSSLSLRVRATDSGSLTFEQVFLISVTNGHEAPTNITLSNASVAENQPSGTAVGTFSATDPDVGDTHTFTLVAGTGSTDNASFQIVGTQLRTNAVFDFETKSSLSLRVRATDSGSLIFEQVFLISVTNGHEAPTNITLSNASVAENQPSGTAVGTFSATDPDVGDTHTFTLVAGTGSTDNASFQIVGTQLRTNAVFDFETKSSLSLRVRATDSGSLTFEQVFLISVTDVDEVIILGLDARNGFDDNSKLATGSDFDIFRETIISVGATIMPLSSFDAGDLVGLDALILKQPFEQNGPGYSSSEITAIQAFVGSGGGLLVLGEGGPGSDPLADNLNALVEPFGVTYAATASEDEGHTITNFVTHPVTTGVTSIGVDFQRRLLSIISPAIDLTTGGSADDALAVVNGANDNGNVVLLSDTSIWRDPDTASMTPITFGDNQLLLQNIIVFIAKAPRISNLSQALTALNTNTCLPPRNTLPFPSRFDVRFDYNDPDGDGNSSAGATVQVDLQFSSGSSDSFDGTPVSTFSGDGFTGSVRVDLCFPFASAQSVDVTVALTDGDGNRSNSLTVNIPRPEGSN